ncbi:MAG: type VI secretion system tube protein Hcp [Chitinispirillaceae bacterium]|nr:type VI secretion system tube protein Hcp [Chitinispirillaceae bacterium]
MPQSPIISIYAPDGKPIPGPVPVEDAETSDLTGAYGEEFSHRVYTIKKDYFFSLLYGVDFVRKHEPMAIVKQIDKMSVPLMKYLTSGTFFQKVEVRWYNYNKQVGRTEEYFRMTLEHVRLERIRYLIPDTKAQQFERYGHLEELQLLFQKITWLYPKGYLTYTDIWNEAYSEVDRKNFGGKKDETEELTETPMVDTLTIKFTSGKFDEPNGGFKFDAKAKVTFTYTASRKPDGKENKVYAKLFAVYNGKTEDLRQVNEGRLVSGDSWSTEFKLKKPEGLKSDSDTVEYYAEVENAFAGTFKSESVTVPKSDTPEFVDVYFENDNGEKIERAGRNKKVMLVISTKNMIGKKVEIDLSDGTIDFEYNDERIGNDLLKDLEITDDLMKIELLTYPQEKT